MSAGGVSAALLAAWQGALAAEHRAVFGYGLLGPRLRGTAQLALAVACSDAHETLRDTTAAALAATGTTPVPPEADYPQLYPVDTAVQARELAVRLERGCAAAWRYLYAVAAQSVTAPDGATTSTPASGTSGPPPEPGAPPDLRHDAQQALVASAVRGVRWDPQAAPPAFPGL